MLVVGVQVALTELGADAGAKPRSFLTNQKFETAAGLVEDLS